MQIRNGDVDLHLTVEGADGAPPLLMLHGITGTVRTWEWMVPHLVDRHRVIRLDFRGHGGSGRAPDRYQPAGYVSDAAAVCREVAGAPCTVIGHSLGGVTAAALAQQHPELVSALVLEDPPLGISRLEGNTLLDGFRLMRESVPRLQSQGIPAAVLAGALAQAPSAVGRTFGEMLHQDALDAMAAGMLELDATVLDPVLTGTTEALFDPSLPISQPTLLITADPASPDAVARPADVEHLRSTSPHVEVRVMSGASHLVHDELAHRDAFLQAVLDFLDRLG